MEPLMEQDASIRKESHRTVIVGGGQAGLALGYFLAQQDEDFIILDQFARTGDSWRCRWDSLRLFTPAQFNSLPGMPFPGPKNTYPPKDEVAEYLEAYARRFNLPIQHATAVKRLSRGDAGYQMDTGISSFQAQNVVIATGLSQRSYTPPFHTQLDTAILQLHSDDYRCPDQLPVESVLVVGAGNSGAEIALELVEAGKQVWLAGRDVGHLPIHSPLGRLLDGRPLWWFMTHILTVKTPIGRKLQARTGLSGAPLGRLHRGEVARAGVNLVPRVIGAADGRPQLEDGRDLSPQAVVWATGFRPDYHWVDLPIFDERGFPRHTRGVAQGAPGLYFLGLPFQTGLSSAQLGGVGRDAAEIASHIAKAGGRP